jgi:hypothetical protein
MKMKWTRTERQQSSDLKVPASVKQTLTSRLLAKHTGGAHVYSCYHFNGSGPRAFGGATRWPVVEVQVSFGAGEEAKRDALAEYLKTAVEKFLKGEVQ